MNQLRPAKICPVCQHALPNDSPDGLCPVCLLQQVLQADSNASTTETIAHETVGLFTANTSLLPESVPGNEHGNEPRFFGDYELHELIARGGMGVVYRATQKSLSRPVALKMIRSGKLSSDLDIQRLRQEAMAAGQLNHPGIVPVYEFDEHEGLHYFSMPFIEGQSLAQRLTNGPLPFREAAEVIREVAEALAYAHSQGVVHRDMKPGNILLDCHGRPHVSDFGLAKQLTSSSDLTASGDVLGTPAFMPPEQASGRMVDVGPLADIYSLGAVLYASLTGRPPFQAPTSVETLRLVVDTLPIAPRLLNPSVPRDLETICLKCLEKEPGRRYANAEHMAADLKSWLGGDPILARPISPLRKVLHWCRVHRASAASAALLAVMICVVTSVLVISNRRLQQLLTKTVSAERNATQANSKAQELLWVSYLSEANAKHHSQQAGQRFGALESLKKARSLPIPADHSMDELRTAATAALGLPDIRVAYSYPVPNLLDNCSVDSEHKLFGFPDIKNNRYTVRDSESQVDKLNMPLEEWLYNYEGPVFSPDSQLLAYPKVVDNETRLHLWKLGSQQPIYDLGNQALQIAFSPDSTYCGTINADSTIRIVDCRKLVEHARFSTSLQLPWLAWNPVQNQLALMSQTEWQVVDAFSGQVLRQEKVSERQTWIAWHPSGRYLATTSSDLRIRIWDVERKQLAMEPLEGFRRGGLIARFSPSGNYLVGNDWGYTLRLWELSSGQQRLTHPMGGVRLEFSHDGRTLAANCSSKRIQILDYVESETVRTLWEKPGRSSTFSVVHGTPCIDNSGRLMAIRTSKGFCLVDIEKCVVIANITARATGPFRFHAAANGELSLWTHGMTGLMNWPIQVDWPANQLTIGPPDRMEVFSQSNHWAANDDGSVIMIPTFEGGLLWNVKTKTSQLLPHPPDIRFCAMNQSGTLGVTASHSNESPGAIVWNCQTKEKIIELPIQAGGLVSISPDNKWLVTHAANTQLWRVGDWQNPRELSDQWSPTCFSPNGQLVAIASGESQIKLIAPDTAREVAVLTASEPELIHPLLFTPDGTKLVAMTDESATLKIFDLVLLRKQLSTLDLDWDFPPFEPAPVPTPRNGPMEVTTHLGDIERLSQALKLLREATQLDDIGRTAEAIDKLRESVQMDPLQAVSHNDLAWHLCTGPEELRNPQEAVAMATVAVTSEPFQAAHHNTLGVALFRNQQYQPAIDSLNRSVELSGKRDSFDAFYLAMAYWHLNEKDQARSKLADGQAWMLRHDPNNAELQLVRKEAEELVAPE